MDNIRNLGTPAQGQVTVFPQSRDSISETGSESQIVDGLSTGKNGASPSADLQAIKDLRTLAVKANQLDGETTVGKLWGMVKEFASHVAPSGAKAHSGGCGSSSSSPSPRPPVSSGGCGSSSSSPSPRPPVSSGGCGSSSPSPRPPVSSGSCGSSSHSPSPKPPVSSGSCR